MNMTYEQLVREMGEVGVELPRQELQAAGQWAFTHAQAQDELDRNNSALANLVPPAQRQRLPQQDKHYGDYDLQPAVPPDELLGAWEMAMAGDVTRQKAFTPTGKPNVLVRPHTQQEEAPQRFVEEERTRTRAVRPQLGHSVAMGVARANEDLLELVHDYPGSSLAELASLRVSRDVVPGEAPKEPTAQETVELKTALYAMVEVGWMVRRYGNDTYHYWLSETGSGQLTG